MEKVAQAYKKAGVDINKTSKIKLRIKSLAKKTFSSQVLSEIGLFGGLYDLSRRTDYTRGSTVLVASCDGVGTKLNIAQMMNKHNTVGEDLVNHCVNDILTLGAKPLFFLDYIAYSEVNSTVIEEVVSGLTNGCRKNNCALIGGETAMMPGMYKKGEYDLVGFIVGIVDKDKIIDGKKIKVGDKLIGLPSSGLHTNGYSLARKIFFTDNKFTINTKLPGLSQPLGELLLKTHRSYLKQVYPLLSYIAGIAHITGGGFFENLERLLPKKLSCIIYQDTWQIPKIFTLIQKYGNITNQEMYRVFNMGIGMILFVRPNNVDKIVRRIPNAKIIGEVIKGNKEVRIISSKSKIRKA
ncbi:MAG: phosphoribosylformylglycinamidine cyclo-ligase [candidate division WOR-3 bacterium]|nr:phosphoribosylformylglycinamidine cyclo-ligase [candidate division WOR-3 bacterium]